MLAPQRSMVLKQGEFVFEYSHGGFELLFELSVFVFNIVMNKNLALRF